MAQPRRTKKRAPAAATTRRQARPAPRPAEAEPGIGPGSAAAIYFGLAVLYFLPAFLPGRHIFGTDYLQAGYFFQEFISNRLAAGELPKWVPFIYGGLPLHSNPGSTYYPIRWIADLLFPAHRILPTIFVFQFGMAGLGMYLLARELGCRRWVAFVAGLAFQFTGLTTSYVYAGHDGRVIVATLAPLVFFFLHLGFRTGSLAAFAGLAATLGFALLSFQIQSCYYLLLGAGIWSVYCAAEFGLLRRPRALLARAGLAAASVAFAFALAAVNFLPFLAYVSASPRGGSEGRGWEYAVRWSMPLEEITALAVPEQAGVSIQNADGSFPLSAYRGTSPFKLHTEYAGAFALVLLALGLAYARRSRTWWVFLGLGLFTLTIAFGGHLPFYRLYYELLPGTKRFRAPGISFFLVSFSLVAMAALALERLAKLRDAAAERAGGGRPAEGLDKVPWIAAGVVALALVGAALLGTQAGGAAAQGGPGGGSAVGGWLRFALFAALVGGILWLWTARRIGATAALLALSVVTVADLWVVDRKFFRTVPAPEQMFPADAVVRFLRSQPQLSRVWILPTRPSYTGGGDYLMHHGIDQAGGEHGNQLQRYNEYVGAGTETYVDWHNFNRDPRFLHAANIRYLISLQPIDIPWLRQVHEDGALVYENLEALPRAWLVGEVIPVADPDSTLAALASPAWDPRRNAVVETARPLGLPAVALQGEARVTRYTPDHVTVETNANRPALLVLADNMYDGWRATLDGTPTQVHRTNHTFRGVVVPAGRHEVTFVFSPADLQRGFFVYLAGLALLGTYGGFLLVRQACRRLPGPARA